LAKANDRAAGVVPEEASRSIPIRSCRVPQAMADDFHSYPKPFVEFIATVLLYQIALKTDLSMSAGIRSFEKG
jgi:hypothetical protein